MFGQLERADCRSELIGDHAARVVAFHCCRVALRTLIFLRAIIFPDFELQRAMMAKQGEMMYYLAYGGTDLVLVVLTLLARRKKRRESVQG